MFQNGIIISKKHKNIFESSWALYTQKEEIYELRLVQLISFKTKRKSFLEFFLILRHLHSITLLFFSWCIS